jgi:CHAD domain-containing protein
MTENCPTTSGALAIHVLRRNAAAFAEHAPQSHVGSDPEHVHQTRVATRRMRAALRVFRDVIPSELENIDDELRWIAGQLGPVRDLDVQVRRLHDAAAKLGLTQAVVPFGGWLEEQRQRALTSLEDAFESQRFFELTERLKAFDRVEPDPARDPEVADDAPVRLSGAFRRLRKAARGLDVDSLPTAFHKARIRAKRLRYTTEFFQPVYRKPARRLIEATTALQDLLGDHQDGVVSMQRVHEAVHIAAGAWPAETSVALGRLVQWEMQHGEQLRRAFPSTYREVREVWQRLRRAL